MPEDEIIEETTSEDVEIPEENIELPSESDVLDDVPESTEHSTDDSENIESTENEDIEESSVDTVSENDIEELPEDMTEELTEELLAEMTEESTEYIFYMTEQEMEIPFLEKPFTDYSVSEGLLALIFVILLLFFVKSVLFD